MATRKMDRIVILRVMPDVYLSGEGRQNTRAFKSSVILCDLRM